METFEGYAAGKIGASEQYWMYYEILLGKERNIDNIQNFTDKLIFHGVKQEGIFPGDPEFYLRFNVFYMDHVRNLDSLGICYYRNELEIFREKRP